MAPRSPARLAVLPRSQHRSELTRVVTTANRDPAAAIEAAYDPRGLIARDTKSRTGETIWVGDRRLGRMSRRMRGSFFPNNDHRGYSNRGHPVPASPAAALPPDREPVPPPDPVGIRVCLTLSRVSGDEVRP